MTIAFAELSDFQGSYLISRLPVGYLRTDLGCNFRALSPFELMPQFRALDRRSTWAALPECDS